MGFACRVCCAASGGTHACAPWAHRSVGCCHSSACSVPNSVGARKCTHTILNTLPQLDIATILALVKALDSWQGGVVVSSHDVRFLDEVCRSGTVGEDGLPGGQLYEVGSCGITRVKSAAAYAQKVLTRVRKQQERAAAAAAAAAARRGR